MLAPMRVPKLEDLTEGPVLLEMPGMQTRALEQASRRDAGGRKILIFSSTDHVSIRQIVFPVAEHLLKRSFEVYARQDTIFNLSIPFDFPRAESLYSWRGKETSTVNLVQDTGELDRTRANSQLFPFAGAVGDGILTGILGDCPVFWENRSQQRIDTDRRRVSLRTGDGSAARLVTRIWGDTSGFYRGEVDGWQHMRSGETRTFDTWIFQQPVRDLYEVRLAAHQALAAAKGWKGSALTAILRNNAYLQIRRNLLRDESRYILISGVNYGWKQWASDIFLAGVGLGDQEMLAEAVRGLFWERLNYEENAQYYLIASALMARSGYGPNLALCNRCYEFMRDNEEDGAYIPPRGQDPANGLGWKTYMDLFYYADDDSPVSNQGFHCGALLAAAELGLGATEGDLGSACRAYARSFNARGGYFPTSMMRPEVFGGDARYGEAITFAVFGRKSLPDDLVLTHCRHAKRIQTPFGIRVVSKANGELLEANQYGPGNPHGLPPERPVTTCREAHGSFAMPGRGSVDSCTVLSRNWWIPCSFAVSRRNLLIPPRSANRSTPAQDSRMGTSFTEPMRSICGYAGRFACAWARKDPIRLPPPSIGGCNKVGLTTGSSSWGGAASGSAPRLAAQLFGRIRHRCATAGSVKRARARSGRP
jgi:hypothetical protein